MAADNFIHIPYIYSSAIPWPDYTPDMVNKMTPDALRDAALSLKVGDRTKDILAQYHTMVATLTVQISTLTESNRRLGASNKAFVDENNRMAKELDKLLEESQKAIKANTLRASFDRLYKVLNIKGPTVNGVPELEQAVEEIYRAFTSRMDDVCP